MMIEGSGSIPLTSGSGSWRPKNMWIRIRIRNTVKNKFFKLYHKNGKERDSTYSMLKSGTELWMSWKSVFFIRDSIFGLRDGDV
jgi:hypothetical protein